MSQNRLFRLTLSPQFFSSGLPLCRGRRWEPAWFAPSSANRRCCWVGCLRSQSTPVPAIPGLEARCVISVNHFRGLAYMA